MGKKNIILTESQMSRLTNVVIEEQRRFENQGMVDAILDKISELGMNSLTDEEKHILNNPDEKFESDDELDSAEDIIASNEAISRLISSGFIDYKDILILDDNSFQVSDIIDEEGYGFGYFKAGNKIKLVVSDEQDEILVEGMGNPGGSMMRVMQYIKENWEPNIGIPVHVEGIDF
jgi:hypothetical protein